MCEVLLIDFKKSKYKIPQMSENITMYDRFVGHEARLNRFKMSKINLIHSLS